MGNSSYVPPELNDSEPELPVDHDGPCNSSCERWCDKWVEAHTHLTYDAATNYFHRFIDGVHSCNDERCDW
jgi:hypothetical protein